MPKGMCVRILSIIGQKMQKLKKLPKNCPKSKIHRIYKLHMPKGMCGPILNIIAQKMQKLKKLPNFGAKIAQKCAKNTQNSKIHRM